MIDIGEMAKYYGEKYSVIQDVDEKDIDFRRRLAEVLRRNGLIIEAHEIAAGQRYEDSEDVMTGIMGAVSCAMQSRTYPGDAISNDFAAGIVAREPEPVGISPEMAVMIVQLFGRE